MIVKLMGVGDLIAALAIFLTALSPDFLPHSLFVFSVFYLLIKGAMFCLMGNFVSYIDVFCGIYLFLLRAGLSVPVITFLAIIFLLQKNIFSMM